MDASIFVEAWREGIKYGMRREPFIKKTIIALGGIISVLCCSLVGAYYMGQWSNVLHVQNIDSVIQYYNETWPGYINCTYYDIFFINGTYTNQTEADNLKQQLDAKYNTTDSDDDDGMSWQKKGSQWSVIYALAGWTLVLAGINAVLLALGGWFYKPRMIGMFCHNFLMIFDLASIIMTHYYRNRLQGQLAAMSQQSSHADSNGGFSDQWTYQDDANFIDKIWVWQIVVFVLCLMTSNLGCFKCCNRTDIHDSQVRSSVAPSEPDNQNLLRDD